MAGSFESFSVDTVQLYSESTNASPDKVKKAAETGLKGPSTSLPYLDAIQRSFGPGHDVSGIKAHMGGSTSQSLELMNARAFASGDRVAFAESPDLRLAAHEAAHVVQQRAGVQLTGGVGSAGDVYEQHADAVADRVVRGESAKELLPHASETSMAPAIQRYEEVGSDSGDTWRVADNDQAMLKIEQAEGGQMLLTTQGVMDTANAALQNAGQHGSFIELYHRGKTMSYAGQSLLQVQPRFVDHGGTEFNKQMTDANKPGGADSEGDTQDWFKMYADCGRSSRAVMGSQGEAPKALYKKGGDDKETGRSYNPGAWTDEIYLAGMKAFVSDANNEQYLKDEHYTKKWNHFFRSGDNKYKVKTPTSGKEAKEFWGYLDDAGKKAFAAYVQINEAVNPEIGEGYTMATGYDLPGFKGGEKAWNFHWAGVVAKAGADNVTLENYAIMFKPTGDKQKDKENQQRAYDWTNTNWVFQMYGTVKEGQTFHEQHLASGTHGTAGTTFRVKI